MKKVLTMTIASLVTLLAFADANPPAGQLRISNLSRHDVFVVVDGRVIRDRDAHMLVGLRPGYHDVKVYREQKGRCGKTIFGSGVRGKLMHNSRVYVSPGSETRVIINRNGRVSVEKQRVRNGRDRHHNDGYGRDPRDRNWRK